MTHPDMALRSWTASEEDLQCGTPLRLRGGVRREDGLGCPLISHGLKLVLLAL